MTLLNEYRSVGAITKDDLNVLIVLLNPVAPHITEEIWTRIGNKGYLNQTSWPIYDEAKLVDDVVEIPVQFSGKVRGTLSVPVDISQEEVMKLVNEDPALKRYLEGKKIIKEIYVPGKILNIVAK